MLDLKVVKTMNEIEKQMGQSLSTVMNCDEERVIKALSGLSMSQIQFLLDINDIDIVADMLNNILWLNEV